MYCDMFLQALGPGRNEDTDYGADGADRAFAKAYAWRTMHFMGELFGLVERRPVLAEMRTSPLMTNVAVDYEVRKTDLLGELVSFRIPDQEARSRFPEPAIIPELLAEIRPGKKAPPPAPVALKVAPEIPEVHVYQLKISLKGARPPIWRRVLVKPEMCLRHLAQLIHAVMGWERSSDYVFEQKCDFAPGLGVFRRPSVNMRLQERLSLADVFAAGQWKLIFRYETEPVWRHEVVLEKILPWDESQAYPVCIKGKRACPPEKAGGIKVYQRWLRFLVAREFEGVQEFVEKFLGREFDPELFVLAAAQARLEKVEWFDPRLDPENWPG